MTNPTRKLRKLSFVVLAGLGVTVALAAAAQAETKRPSAGHKAGRAVAAQRQRWARTCLERIYEGEHVDRSGVPPHFVAPHEAARARTLAAR